MTRLRTAGKVAALAALSFAAALAVTYGSDASLSVTESLLLSVILCPLVLGFVSGRVLGLGPWGTLLGINALPGAFAVAESVKAHAPLRAGWIAVSCLFALAGLACAELLALRDDEDDGDMAE